MLFRETVAVYYENHTEHTNTQCGQNAEFWYVKAGGTYSNHWARLIRVDEAKSPMNFLWFQPEQYY
jgi:hypothetical protein